MRLRSFELVITPEASVTWMRDVVGNMVATAVFNSVADTLVIESRAALTLEAVAWPVFDIAASAIQYPFRYSDDDQADLGQLAVQQYPDPAGRLQDWARAFVGDATTDTLGMLKGLSAGISERIGYRSREDEGTQSPVETLDRGWGTCRDFALLLVEAARNLGFGARIVSGYLDDRSASAIGQSVTGSTHAWAEIYVPGAGWIAYDPTNRSVGGFNLIPAAVGRDMHQVMPVSGSYAGPMNMMESMTVAVSID